MVNIADLKNYILEEQQIEPILEELGCHHISHKTGYYQCTNPDGDNRTALCTILTRLLLLRVLRSVRWLTSLEKNQRQRL